MKTQAKMKTQLDNVTNVQLGLTYFLYFILDIFVLLGPASGRAFRVS